MRLFAVDCSLLCGVCFSLPVISTMARDEDRSHGSTNNYRTTENDVLHEELEDVPNITFVTSEKTPLLQYKCKEECETQDDSPPVIKAYKSRFWIVFLASVLCWIHNLQWTTWSSISESMKAAFSGWGQSTVALLVNWGTIMYVLFAIPSCWVMQRYGLRAGVVASAALMTIGTGIRCITKKTPAFTILCHICAILTGISSPLAITTPIVIANDWFPLHERTTATGVIIGSIQLGSLGSYLEPLFVPLPSPGVTVADIQQDVMHLVYGEAIMSAAILFALLAYFPSKPPTPPSLSSTTEKIEFRPGLTSIFKNKQFLVITATYAIFVGLGIAWITVLNFSLLPLGIHQDKAMRIGCIAVVVSSVSPIISGRLNDLFQGHIKTLLISFMLVTTAFAYWFLLLSYGILEVTEWQVYVSIIGFFSCNYATMPLFYEVAVDTAFSVPEILLSGVLVASDNLVSTLFLTLYSIPNIGYLWVTCSLTLASSLTIVPLLFMEFSYIRSTIDKNVYAD